MGMKDHQTSFQGANRLDQSVTVEDAIEGLLVSHYLKYTCMIILEDGKEVYFASWY